MDWRDLRVVLAVGTHGGLSAAGRSLGIDPTTVSRRISALEHELGATLFRRSHRKWVPTAAGDAVLAHCGRMAAEARALRHDVDRASGQVGGRVRITAVDAVFNTWLVPAIVGLRAQYPSLELELYATNANVDLERGQADVAIRLARPERAGLIARKVRELDLVIAGRPEVAERPIAERPVILLGFVDSESPENRAAQQSGGPIAVAATSFSVLLALILEGVGIGVLPARMAAARGLTVVDADVPARGVWRAVPEALADAPRIRAVCDWIDAAFSET